MRAACMTVRKQMRRQLSDIATGAHTDAHASAVDVAPRATVQPELDNPLLIPANLLIRLTAAVCPRYHTQTHLHAMCSAPPDARVSSYKPQHACRSHEIMTHDLAVQVSHHNLSVMFEHLYLTQGQNAGGGAGNMAGGMPQQMPMMQQQQPQAGGGGMGMANAMQPLGQQGGPPQGGHAQTGGTSGFGPCGDALMELRDKGGLDSNPNGQSSAHITSLLGGQFDQGTVRPSTRSQQWLACLGLLVSVQTTRVLAQSGASSRDA